MFFTCMGNETKKLTNLLTTQWHTPCFIWSLISPVVVLDKLHGPVQCLTWISLTHTDLLIDTGKIFDLNVKIAIFENMTSKITVLQYKKCVKNKERVRHLLFLYSWWRPQCRLKATRYLSFFIVILTLLWCLWAVVR